MTDRLVYDLLSSSLTCGVFTDYVPESAPKPAVTFVNVSFQSSRVYCGQQQQTHSIWRVTALANSKQELTPIINELISIDNTSTKDFADIFVIHTHNEGANEYELYDRAFFELTVYN